MTTASANGDEIRQIIESWERIEAEKKDRTEEQKEVMAGAKSRGYDVKVIKALIAKRKQDPNDLAEFEAVFEMYEAAVGMG